MALEVLLCSGAKICVTIATIGGGTWGAGSALAPHFFSRGALGGGPNLRVYFYNIAST